MYREVSAQIERVIKSKALWEKYLAPERELAQMFGVSRETVRKSLHLLGRRGVISRRHGQGTLVLPRRKTGVQAAQGRVTVASCGGGAWGPHASGVLAGLTSEAGRMGWSLTFRDMIIPAVRQEFFVALRSGQIDGLLLVSVTDRLLIEEVLGVWRGPAVLADHYFGGLPVTSVIDDSQDGARQATEHLLSLGHRRIGYVEVSVRESNPWRYQGYSDALRAAGIEPDEALVVPSFASFDSGRLAGEKLLELSVPPTAVLTFDDLRAWGVWRSAEARGLSVGRDFAIVGYGDTAVQAGFPEELSSVRFSSRDLGRLAVEKLAAQIAGREQPGDLVKVPTELMIRKSSRDARFAVASGTGSYR
jgi:LacI family transcriptional regulator